MLKRFFPFHTFILYLALGLAVLLLCLRWAKYHFVFLHDQFEYYSAVIAILFTGLGIWLMRMWAEVKVEKEVKVETKVEVRGEELVSDGYGLSAREFEVLQLVSKGFSNQEIAEQLFVSLNTVKTHISNILSKLDVKRRTQAVDAARRRGIIS